MTDNYEIVFEIESKCDKELKKEMNKSRIPIDKYFDKIIHYSVLFYENGREAHIHKFYPAIHSKLFFEATLYCIRLGTKERALITIDEDEIFDKLIITLWAFTLSHDYEKIFRRLSESMYQKYVNQGDILE